MTGPFGLRPFRPVRQETGQRILGVGGVTGDDERRAEGKIEAGAHEPLERRSIATLRLFDQVALGQAPSSRPRYTGVRTLVPGAAGGAPQESANGRSPCSYRASRWAVTIIAIWSEDMPSVPSM